MAQFQMVLITSTTPIHETKKHSNNKSDVTRPLCLVESHKLDAAFILKLSARISLRYIN